MNQSEGHTEGHSEPTGKPMTAKEEAALKGISVRTVYKQRALLRSSERSELRSERAVPPLTLQDCTQVNGQSEYELTIGALTAEMNEMKGTMKAQTAELEFYRALMRTMLPAESRTPQALPLWVFAVLALIVIVGAAVLLWIR